MLEMLIFGLKRIILVSGLLITNSSFAEESVSVSLSLEECEENICAIVSIENAMSSNLCIANGSLPFDDEIDMNIFEIVDTFRNKIVDFKLIDSVPVLNNKRAALVRLIPPEGVATSRMTLSDAYEMNREKSYWIRYFARIFLCEEYSDFGEYIAVEDEALWKGM